MYIMDRKESIIGKEYRSSSGFAFDDLNPSVSLCSDYQWPKMMPSMNVDIFQAIVQVFKAIRDVSVEESTFWSLADHVAHYADKLDLEHPHRPLMAMLLGGVITRQIRRAVHGKEIAVDVTQLRSMQCRSFVDFMDSLSGRNRSTNNPARPELGKMDKFLTKWWDPLRTFFKCVSPSPPAYETLAEYRLQQRRQQRQPQSRIFYSLLKFKALKNVKQNHIGRLSTYLVPQGDSHAPAVHLYECLLYFIRDFSSLIGRYWIFNDTSSAALHHDLNQCSASLPPEVVPFPSHVDATEIAIGIDLVIHRWSSKTIVLMMNFPDPVAHEASLVGRQLSKFLEDLSKSNSRAEPSRYLENMNSPMTCGLHQAAPQISSGVRPGAHLTREQFSNLSSSPLRLERESALRTNEMIPQRAQDQFARHKRHTEDQRDVARVEAEHRRERALRHQCPRLDRPQGHSHRRHHR